MIGRSILGDSRFTDYGVSGFTLLELMVVVAVVAILATVAYPSFNSLINSNRLVGTANQILASLQHARSEAIRLNRRVAICPANADDTACQEGGSPARWLTVVVDTGEVLSVTEARAPIQVLSSGNVTSDPSDRVVFSADGFARTAGGLLLDASIAACLPTAQPADNVRSVSIGSGSRLRVVASNGGAACVAPANVL